MINYVFFFFTIFQHHWERERLVNYWRDWGGATVELDIGRSHSLCLANSDHIFRNISYPRLPKYHSQHYLFLISVFFSSIACIGVCVTENITFRYAYCSHVSAVFAWTSAGSCTDHIYNWPPLHALTFCGCLDY